MPELLGYQFDRVYAGAIERYRQVATIAERDAIPSGKRWEGMLCYVTSANQDYQLKGGLTNLDWVNSGEGDYFDINTDTSDDITEGITNLFLSAADQAKLDFITVTQAVDLDQLESDVAALGAGVNFVDEWDASSGSFPGGGTTAIGDLYLVTTAGTVDGVSFSVGDGIIAKVVNASTTTFSGNWIKTQSNSDVTSVVGLTGAISKSALLAALNVEDGATADMSGAEIVALITAQLTTSDWQTRLSNEDVLDFVGAAINAGTQSNITVTYDDANDRINFSVVPATQVYASLATLLADQSNQNDWVSYEITDASGFTGISSGRAWVRYKGTANGLESDYIIRSQEETSGTGTVTSVAQTVPTGFVVSGSPITASGTLAISYDTGYQAYTTAEASKLAGIQANADVTDATKVDAAGAVMESDFDANTILSANTDNTPAPITISEQQVIGRLTGENIKGLSQSELRTLLAYVEELIEGTATYNGTTTGAVNLDLSTFSSHYAILTGNTTWTFTGTPASGKSFVKEVLVKSNATESLTLNNADFESGTFTPDGTLHRMMVSASNYPTVGLIISVQFSLV